jgi:hypothetical protein
MFVTVPESEDELQDLLSPNALRPVADGPARTR